MDRNVEHLAGKRDRHVETGRRIASTKVCFSFVIYYDLLRYMKMQLNKNTKINQCCTSLIRHNHLYRELERPLPKTVGECKGHPLYVLVRHLLKYEALYPADCVPLGHLKTGEAIYSRYCVYTLCSRETWLKKARVVKPKQEPYKIVKALPKYDKVNVALTRFPQILAIDWKSSASRRLTRSLRSFQACG